MGSCKAQGQTDASFPLLLTYDLTMASSFSTGDVEKKGM